MTYKANAAPTPEPETSEEDKTLPGRRLLAWVVSAVLALATSIFILQVGVKLIWPNNGAIPLDAQVQISFLNINLLVLLMIPMTLFFVIWVDYFLHSKVLND